MVAGIPLPIITALVGTVLSGWLRLRANAIEAEERRSQLDRVANDQAMAAVAAAHNRKGKGFSWVRRTIALIITICFFGIPTIAPFIDPDVAITFVMDMWNPGGLFTESYKGVKIVVAEGIVWTPLHTHLASLVYGYFFGAEIVRPRR